MGLCYVCDGGHWTASVLFHFYHTMQHYWFFAVLGTEVPSVRHLVCVVLKWLYVIFFITEQLHHYWPQLWAWPCINQKLSGIVSESVKQLLRNLVHKFGHESHLYATFEWNWFRLQKLCEKCTKCFVILLCVRYILVKVWCGVNLWIWVYTSHLSFVLKISNADGARPENHILSLKYTTGLLFFDPAYRKHFYPKANDTKRKKRDKPLQRYNFGKVGYWRQRADPKRWHSLY